LSIAVISGLFCIQNSRNKSKAPQKPNIVMIVVDTLRADHLPFYGYRKNTALFLTELSTRSVIFENAYSASSWTAPASASFFTSLYPFQHGVVTGFMATRRLKEKNPEIVLNRIPDEITTIAEVLKNFGYTTYAVTDNLNICEEEGFTQGFDNFTIYGDKGAQAVNKEFKKWAEAIKTSHPYFIYIHYNDPHSPYLKRFPWYEESPYRALNILSAYDSEISFVDSKIRELFELFEWESHTLLILTADHGEEFHDHGLTGHGKTLYSEVIHVPLLMYFPEGAFRAKRVIDNVSTIDILPTVRELIGLPRDHDNEGVSLLRYLRGKETYAMDRYLFSHVWRKKGESDNEIVKKAAIHSNWKYIYSLPDSEEIYNLKMDPYERMNVLKEESHVVRLLKKKLFAYIKNCRKYKQAESHVHLTQTELEELKSLGYLQ